MWHEAQTQGEPHQNHHASADLEVRAIASEVGLTILFIGPHGVPHAKRAIALQPLIQRLDVQVRRAAHAELDEALRWDQQSLSIQ